VCGAAIDDESADRVLRKEERKEERRVTRKGGIVEGSRRE
jgi:hypothetical protein